MNEITFFADLQKLNYQIDDFKKEKLMHYLKLIIEYNNVMDLTANTSEEEILEKNFYDSIISLPSNNYQNKSLIDVGSGAGFPGILYAIIFPELEITLLEPMHKRVDFLMTVKEALKLTNVEIVCSRAEDYVKNHRESFDYASARGVAKLNILFELIMPFLKVKGIFIALKAKKAFEEEKEALNAMKILDVSRINVKEFFLPTNKETRINLYYQKQKQTCIKYPRNYANIKKKPL